MDNYIFEYIKKYKPNVNFNEIKITNIDTALSNYVYKVECKLETFILRIFGNPYYNIDLQIYLNKLNIYPKILFSNNKFSIEEFVDGKQLTLKDFTNVNIYRKIAQKLKKIHKKNITHNDLHYNNLLIDKKDEIHILDFEFAKKNSTYKDKMLDICNLFCEWMYDYSKDNWYDLDINNFPSKEIQLDFLKYYDSNLDYQQSLKDINENLNICHSNWIEWSIEKYKRTNNIDYLLYCEKRIKVNKIINNKYIEIIYNLI